MALSKRLEQVAMMIPQCHTVADVGTDHGFLAVALIEKEIAQQVLAIDVNRGPLESAKRFVKERGLEQQITCRLGDGLAATLEGEVDCAVICGMGGELMQHIISVGPEWLQTYVLQPQSHREELKKFLVQNGYGITEEQCLQEGKQYYDIWVVERGVSSVYVIIYSAESAHYNLLLSICGRPLRIVEIYAEWRRKYKNCRHLYQKYSVLLRYKSDTI